MNNRKILKDPAIINFQLERVAKEKIMSLAMQQGLPVSIWLRQLIENAIHINEKSEQVYRAGP